MKKLPFNKPQCRAELPTHDIGLKKLTEVKFFVNDKKSSSSDKDESYMCPSCMKDLSNSLKLIGKQKK